MKIIQNTIRYYPALGGVEEYVKRLSEGLVLIGHKVYVFTSNLAQHTNSLSKLTGLCNENINGVKVIREYTLPLRMRHYSIMPFMPINMLGKKADIIHGHCFMSFPADVAGLVARFKNIPFIFNPYFTQYCPSSFLGRFYRKTLGALAMAAKVVITISDFEKRLIEEAGYRLKRCEMVSPGVDINEFNDNRINIYDRYFLKEKKIILFVGRIDYNKGIDILIMAARIVIRKFSEVIFFIAGADFGELANLKALISEYTLERYFIFSGPLSRLDLISAFKYADIFAFPSRYEAFGITLIEAMAAKTAVVASDSSAIPFVVKHGETGLLFPLNSSQVLAEELLYLLQNDKIRSELAENGYQNTLKRFTWKDTIIKINRIYNDVVRS